MSIRSLGSAEWLVIARFALMGLEMLLVKANWLAAQSRPGVST